MAVALTEINRQVFNDGNKLSILYSVAFTVTYPSGGYDVANAQFPSAANVFKRIDRLTWHGGPINENDYLFLAPHAEIVNSTATNPAFVIRVYDPTTGGGGRTELGTGDTFIQTAYLIVEGVKAGGIAGVTT